MDRGSDIRHSKISVVIDNYNYERYLGEAIESVLNQTRAPWELIVVDDGSTDNSQEVIRSFGDRVEGVLKENGGQGSAFNAGFSVASGEWILFLDADDRLCPGAIETLEELVADVSARCSRIFWKRRLIDENGDILRTPNPVDSGPRRRDFVQELNSGETFVVHPTSSNLFRRESLARILPMPESEYRVCADTYLAWKTALVGEGIELGRYLNDYRIHGNNAFQETGKMTKERLRKKLHWWSQDFQLEKEMPGREKISFLTSSQGRREIVIKFMLYGIQFQALPEIFRKESRREWETAYCQRKGSGKKRLRDLVRVMVLRCLPRGGSNGLLNWAMRSRWLP